MDDERSRRQRLRLLAVATTSRCSRRLLLEGDSRERKGTLGSVDASNSNNNSKKAMPDMTAFRRALGDGRVENMPNSAEIRES